MSNFYTLGELARIRQHELRQEAQYAAQLRQRSGSSQCSFVRSHWKLAAALGTAVLMALSHGVIS